MKIKICGLTKESETKYVNERKVDFTGFVLFFPKSKRNNTIENAKKIMRLVDPTIKKVAVTVKPSQEQIQAIEEAGFDYIQIHGEIEETLFDAIQIPVLKAFNVSDMDAFNKYNQKKNVAGFVLDAPSPGSGKTFDWNLIKELPQTNKMILLAGGLTPENVKDALSLPIDGVDVSSGVEYTDKPGKDPEKIVRFVQAVRSV
ncbi:MAG: phosphoribosylanthranilate isomerase [Firmicutes bacterium]|nr:phosphoribosylanthranilate isomerase [Bacillota bacterium]